MICADCPALQVRKYFGTIYTCSFSGHIILDINQPPESCQPPVIWLEPEELEEVLTDGKT